MNSAGEIRQCSCRPPSICDDRTPDPPRPIPFPLDVIHIVHWLRGAKPSAAERQREDNLVAALAEKERALISARTKAASAAVKARGIKLGNPSLA
jgi:hypothetical protein